MKLMPRTFAQPLNVRDIVDGMIGTHKEIYAAFFSGTALRCRRAGYFLWIMEANRGNKVLARLRLEKNGEGNQ